MLGNDVSFCPVLGSFYYVSQDYAFVCQVWDSCVSLVVIDEENVWEVIGDAEEGCISWEECDGGEKVISYV